MPPPPNLPVRRDQNIQVGLPPNPDPNPPVRHPNLQIQPSQLHINQPVNPPALQVNHAQNANITLDTTGLEGSFTQLGQSMLQIRKGNEERFGFSP